MDPKTSQGKEQGTESQESGSYGGADNNRNVHLPAGWKTAHNSGNALADLFHMDREAVSDVLFGLRREEYLFCAEGEWYLYSVPTEEGWHVLEPKGKQALLDELAGERKGLQVEEAETYDD